MKIGDIVMLKSGGPKMVVKYLYMSGRDEVKVTWIHNGKQEEATFPEACLVRVPEHQQGNS